MSNGEKAGFWLMSIIGAGVLGGCVATQIDENHYVRNCLEKKTLVIDQYAFECKLVSIKTDRQIVIIDDSNRP